MLEHETFLLAEAYGWDPPTIKAMSCSERHRYVKMKEEVVKQDNLRANGQATPAATSIPTGLTRNSTDAPERSVSVEYTGS
jgi:hypothetical protein